MSFTWKNRDAAADNPEVSREKILNDSFLYFVYRSIYKNLVMVGVGDQTTFAYHDDSLQIPGFTSVEIGSAGGILKSLSKNFITSDVRICEGVDVFVDAQELPFADQSVDLIIGKDALHHLPNVSLHFDEVERVLRRGGVAVYLEPNWNRLSKFIYRYIHPEPWNEVSKDWNFKSKGPMDSNQALAKVIFVRDLQIFEKDFPRLKVEIISKPVNGLTFLVSGGVHARNSISSKFLIATFKLESLSETWMKIVGLNRIIKITKI